MREPLRSYLHSLYVSCRTGNMNGFRPRILSFHRNVIKCEKGSRFIVGDRIHLSTRRNTWPGSCYIDLGRNSTLHFTGRASLRGEGRIVLDDGARLVIGDHCILRERLWLNVHQEVTIGDRSGIGQDCMILDSDVHAIVIDGIKQPSTKPVHIGKHVWVGAHSIILKGVSIGDETVIGAGSLVTTDIPDHCLAFGRPATPQHSIDCWGASWKEPY